MAVLPNLPLKLAFDLHIKQPLILYRIMHIKNSHSSSSDKLINRSYLLQGRGLALFLFKIKKKKIANFSTFALLINPSLPALSEFGS